MLTQYEFAEKKKIQPSVSGPGIAGSRSWNTYTEKLSSAELGSATFIRVAVHEDASWGAGIPTLPTLFVHNRRLPESPKARVLRKSDIEKKVCPKSALRCSRVVRVEITPQSREKKSFDSASQTNAR